MLCPNCHAEQPDTNQFCSKCGCSFIGIRPEDSTAAPQSPPSDAAQPADPAVSPQAEPPKKRKVWIAAAAAVVVILVVVIAVAAAALRTVEPYAAIASAAGKTFEANEEQVQQLQKALGLDDVRKAMQSEPMEETLTLTLQEDTLTGMDLLSGTSISLSSQTDLKNKKLALELSAGLGSYPLGAIQLYQEESLLAIGSPQLTGGAFYGVHTDTLGEDLKNAPWAAELGLETPEDLDLDLSSWMERDGSLLASETTEAIKDAALSFLEEQTFDEQTMPQTINGDAMELTVYTVSPTRESMAVMLTYMIHALAEDPLTEELSTFLATGLFGYAPDEFLSEMRMLEPADLEAVLPEAIRLRFGLDSEGLRLFELVIEPTEQESLSLRLDFGTAEELANAVSMTLSDGYSTIILSSQGQHVLEDGVWSDTTTLTVDHNEVLCIDTVLDTSAETENFSCTATLSDSYSPLTLRLAGSVHGEGKRFSADLSTLELELPDISLILGASYSVAPSDGMTIDGSGAQILTDMTTEELAALMDELEENLYEVAASVMGGALAFLF